MIARIRTLIRAARETPTTGAPRSEYQPNCRLVIEQPYLIYYDFDGAVMTVLRVLHHARDRDALMRQR